MKAHLAILILAGVEAGFAAEAEPALPTVAEHERYRAILQATNPYDRAVKIERVDSTCPCALPSLDDDAYFILPHQTVPMSIEVDNANRSGRQDYDISLYLTDPAAEPIELTVSWVVVPDIQVDLIAPGADPLRQPEDRGFRDVYRYVAKTRPDELHRLSKRVRLACPDAAALPGGLQVTGVEYAGRLWAFTPQAQTDGSVLVLAAARDPAMADPPLGLIDEKAVLLTNHPHKPRITLTFTAYIGKDAGTVMLDPGALKPGPDGGLPESGVVGSGGK